MKAEDVQSFRDVVREVFPDATDAECDNFLWERTGFPCFWNTEDPAQEVRESLLRLRQEQEQGLVGEVSFID
jgi:hypothetical protein